jgi:[ribosomal protein S18]-alanine N-acetyltransferase
MVIRIEHQPQGLTYPEFAKVDRECFPDEPGDEGLYQAFLSQDFWAAWDGETLAGYCSAYSKPDLFWIRRIGIAASHRRQGIGRELMSRSLAYCREMGLAKAMLYVLEDNMPALRLYEAFGFEKAEATYQFLWDLPLKSEFPDKKVTQLVQALPVDEVSEASLPELTEQWADFRAMHQPPGQYALIFRDERGETVGYCRLSPGFPGCFPFAVTHPEANLPGALLALRKYLLPERDHLKLTLSDRPLAEACEALGLKLNCKLYKMVRTVSG